MAISSPDNTPQNINDYYECGEDPRVFEFGVTPQGDHFRIIDGKAIFDHEISSYIHKEYPRDNQAGSPDSQAEPRVLLESPEAPDQAISIQDVPEGYALVKDPFTGEHVLQKQYADEWWMDVN